MYHYTKRSKKNINLIGLNNWLYRFVFRNADVILLSKLLYQDIENFVPESRIHICPNGIEDMATKTDIDKKEINGTTKLLFLSNLIESKGVFVLLEACALLKEKGLLFECDFIGGEADITETSFNEKLKQLNLDKQVHYIGKKYNEEKKKAFEEADIFVFPTYYSNECFPLVLLEAISHSLPVVSTLEGGIPDIIEDGVKWILNSTEKCRSTCRKTRSFN
jgi:glycosyltransferase involved in cell wall biosynthesis